ARDWYKDAVFYEVHVKAFMDGNGDGVGDFVGLTERLDYLAELGVDCLWVLPMYASPRRDDGYDIADFYAVHPAYGTLEEFQKFLDAAHARELLAPVLQPPARPQLRHPRGPPEDARRHALLARPRPGRLPLRRGAVPRGAGGHELREPARDPRGPQGIPRGHRPRVRGRPGPARRGEPVAGGRARLLRRRRRVPHGVPLPADAPPLPGAPPRGAAADRRYLHAHAADPARVPVGSLPP